MKKHYIVVSALLVFGFIFTACATPPTEEMDRAHDAVIRAESDPDAVAFAPNTLVRARDALTRMQAEAGARRFDAARNLASEAISLAERAILDGRSGAARARAEAETLVNGLIGQLADTAAALGAAERAGNLALDLDPLSRDLDSAYRSYNGARESLDANDYRDAIAQGQDVRNLLSGINARLNAAAQLALLK